MVYILGHTSQLPSSYVDLNLNPQIIKYLNKCKEVEISQVTDSWVKKTLKTDIGPV